MSPDFAMHNPRDFNSLGWAQRFSARQAPANVSYPHRISRAPGMSLKQKRAGAREGDKYADFFAERSGLAERWTEANTLPNVPGWNCQK
jgi:hypothetical protein